METDRDVAEKREFAVNRSWRTISRPHARKRSKAVISSWTELGVTADGMKVNMDAVAGLELEGCKNCDGHLHEGREYSREEICQNFQLV